MTNVIDYSKALSQEEALDKAREGWRVKRVAWEEDMFIIYAEPLDEFLIIDSDEIMIYHSKTDISGYVSKDWHVIVKDSQ